MGVVILKDKLFTGRNRVSSMIVLSKRCDMYTGYPILVSKNNANHGFVSLTQYLSYITLKTTVCSLIFTTCNFLNEIFFLLLNTG